MIKYPLGLEIIIITVYHCRVALFNRRDPTRKTQELRSFIARARRKCRAEQSDLGVMKGEGVSMGAPSPVHLIRDATSAGSVLLDAGSAFGVRRNICTDFKQEQIRRAMPGAGGRGGDVNTRGMVDKVPGISGRGSPRLTDCAGATHPAQTPTRQGCSEGGIVKEFSRSRIPEGVDLAKVNVACA